MENTPRLYCELVALFGQSSPWCDVRHLYTFTWLVVGLIHAGSVSLAGWVTFVRGRARYARSTQRRFARGLQNPRIEVQALYAPLIQQALAEWGNHTRYLALDTTMLWNRYCIVRIAILYRGRAVPLVWQGLEHGSSSGAHEGYAAFLGAIPPPFALGGKVGFLADRGVSDTALFAHLRRLRWDLPLP